MLHHKVALNQDEPRTNGPPRQRRRAKGKLQRGNNYPDKHRESGGPTSCRSHAKDDQGRNTDHSTVPLPRQNRRLPMGEHQQHQNQHGRRFSRLALLHFTNLIMIQERKACKQLKATPMATAQMPGAPWANGLTGMTHKAEYPCREPSLWKVEWREG